MFDDNVEENIEAIKELWAEHKAARFPGAFRGRDVSGIDFVLLDADIAGCVTGFLEHGTLDVWRTALLGLRYHDCEHILPILSEQGVEYFWRLGRIADLILKTIEIVERPTA